MSLGGLSRWGGRIIGGVIAYLVALLPERIKEREPFCRFQSDAAHFFSGITECVFALALFVFSYDQVIGKLSLGVSRAMAAGGGIAEGQMRGIGLLGHILSLLHPIALISVYLFVEGMVRAFSAAATGQHQGIGVFWAIQRIAMLGRAKKQSMYLRMQLGPKEPDSLFKDETSGGLVLTSIDDKPWRERQVVQYGDDFYILSIKNFVPKNKHYRFRYTFKPMHPGEIIRGTVVVIPSAACR
jgi:hypothetical protein